MTLPRSFGVDLDGSRMGRRAASHVSARASSTPTRASTTRAWSCSTRSTRGRAVPTSACAPTLAGARREGGAAGGRRSPRATARRRRSRARAIVNAAGPWVKRRARQRQRRAVDARTCATSRAATSSCRACIAEDHAYILQNADKRIVFVIPYRGPLLADRHDRRPGRRLRASGRSPRRRSTTCCELANTYLDDAARAAPTSSGPTAASGPLYDDGCARSLGDHARLRAEGRCAGGAGTGRARCCRSIGGKITTYRKLAEHVLDRIAARSSRR